MVTKLGAQGIAEQFNERNAALMKDGSVRVAAAVKEYGIGRSTLYKLMNSGAIKYSMVRRMRLIPRSELARLLAENLVARSSE